MRVGCNGRRELQPTRQKRSCTTWLERKFWPALTTVLGIIGIVFGVVLLILGVGQDKFVSKRDAGADFQQVGECSVEEVWARMVSKTENCGRYCQRTYCVAQVVYTFSGPFDGDGSAELSGFRMGSGVGYDAVRNGIRVHDNSCHFPCNERDGFMSVERTNASGFSTTADHLLSRAATFRPGNGLSNGR